ncbi:NACHT, LRR and PYD domains-containing protein 5-like [Halichondria panicea]|uniref:NACHT, LRR and PYD domains-containing protein 5-like n=1 Tax=Halichondria panicea TaxID=6063 RepID=UPI00312B8808
MEKLMMKSLTRKEKILELVKIMCIKGDRAPSLFTKSVRDAAEHLPHSDLADKLENWLINNSATVTLATSSGSELTSRSQQPNKLSSEKQPAPGDNTIQGVKRGAQSDVTMSTDLQPPPLRRPRPDRSHDKLIGSRTEESDRLPEQSSTSQSNLQFRQPPHEFGRQYIPPSGDDQSRYSSPLVRSSSTRSERHSIDESPLQVLIKTLRTSYADEKFFKKSAGINKGTIKFINLALVKKKGISAADAENDEFLQSTLHGSVDDIIKKKKEDINLQGIFTYGKEGSRKLVLVEGAPGVGKTMLALHMCQLWANKDLLDEYDMVLLVTLRRYQRKPLVELSDLLIYLQGPLLAEATEKLLRSQGERTLFILEGWDELSPTLREEGSFFFDIVEGNILPKASVLVTSRPTVTSDLYEYMDERHIEVLGFSTKEITQYVQFHGGDMSETVLSHLNKFPNLKALAHIPLTLSIICHVARKDLALPHTLTELYRQHICNTLFLTLKKHVTFKSLSGVSCLEELPVKVRSVINSLCTLALDGFKEKKFVYSKEDLQRVGLKPNAFDGYGLLNAPVMTVAAGFEQIYQFNHLSIQEFLAAYGIQHLVNDQRVSLLREFRNDKQFQNIWKFFSGITRLENEYFKELIISGTGKANRDQIFLLHCLYEADNPAISKKAAEKMFYVLNLGNMLLNTTDCLCAAHMITSAGGDWQVELRGCNMGDDGLRIFKTSLLTHIEAHGVLGFTIKRLDLTQNRIRAVSVCHLAEMINSKMQLHSLILSSNPFGDEGMRTLTRALKQSHATTKSLHFSSCELTKDGAFELADVLRANSTIEELYIGFEQFGCHGVTRIAQALDNRYNKALTELSLTKTDMTSVGLTALAQMAPVNQTLEVLRLDRNDLVADDCHLVATIIEKSSSLILIDLSKNPIGDVGFVRVLEALIVKRKGSLKKLGVFGCDVTPKGLKKLMELFSVTETFVGIQLGCNHLGDEGAELVGEALKRNSSNSVKQVLMEATKVTDEGKKKLQEICDSINSGRDTENKLDLNYKHHSQVVQKRNSTNYL